MGRKQIGDSRSTSNRFLNKLARLLPSPITTVQEGEATSSIDVAEPVTDSTEVG